MSTAGIRHVTGSDEPARNPKPIMRAVSTNGNRRAKGTHIGMQNGPTWVQKFTCLGWSLWTLPLFLDGLRVTFPPPGETESGSAGTQPDKG